MNLRLGEFAIVCEGQILKSAGQFRDMTSAEVWIEMCGDGGLRYQVIECQKDCPPKNLPEHNF